MKAMQFKGYGAWQKLGCVEIQRPVPKARQLLVEIAATSVNPVDWKLHSDPFRWIPSTRIPRVPCFDFAGTVSSTGDAVQRFKPGEPVFGMLPLQPVGAATEFTTVDESLVARVPANVDLHSAAGMPLAGLTALQGLRDDGRLCAGQRVLVIGASGGVGHFAVQIGKILGAHVIGICSGRNVDWVRALGADEVFDYTAGGVPQATSPFDVIFDAVVSRPFRDWQPLLAPEGTYVSLLPSVDLLIGKVAARFRLQQRIRFTLATPSGQDMEALATFAKEGRLRTRIDSVFALNELSAAFEKSRSGRVRGKIIIEVTSGKPL